MITRVAEGVFVHESSCLQTNSTVVVGDEGVLLVDPGLTTDELATIAADVRALGQPVAAGFSTHPDWDHVLWHASFGEVPRYGTAQAAGAMKESLAQPDWQLQVAEGLPKEIADDVPMELLGLITALPVGAKTIAWGGPTVRILEHAAHATGHAALLIDDRRVLVAGDMLSDVLVPCSICAVRPTRLVTISPRSIFSSASRARSTSLSPGTVRSAGRPSCGSGSLPTARTSRRCATAVTPMTRASAPTRSRAGNGSSTFTRTRSSGWASRAPRRVR